MASKSGITLMNSTSSRLRLARTFLRSFSKIKSETSSPHLKRQSRRIKMAAYSSMARVAGPRRAWARALLFKLHTRPTHRTLMNTPPGASTTTPPSSRSDNQVGKLRRLLPGGDRMDVCTLLEETANYIHCLSTQVKPSSPAPRWSNSISLPRSESSLPLAIRRASRRSRTNRHRDSSPTVALPDLVAPAGPYPSDASVADRPRAVDWSSVVQSLAPLFD